jgi:tRNA nucleotidyltransferase (CCA-adding enzyme)
MNAVAAIGDNKPSIDFFPTREQLEYENEELIRRRDELLAAAERIPPIADDDVARRVSDFIKQVMAAVKASEAARVKAKEPYLEGAQRAAFSAHGSDEQELRAQLRLMCEAIDALNKMRRGVERGLGR